MYDQFGFYSENGCRGGAGGGAGAGSAARTWVSAGSIFPMLSRAAAARGRPHGQPKSSANFQDIFSQWFGRQQAEAEPRRSAEKGADLEYGLNIDFWQAIKGTQVRLNITRQEVVRDLRRHRRAARAPTPFARSATAAAT